jgi:hypothetical protein
MVAMVKRLSSVIIAVIAATIAFGAASPLRAATAQGDAAAAPNTRAVTTDNPCKNPGARLIPPPGFDPNTATDAAIAAQAFPHRPGPHDNPASGYENAWKQYVTWYLAGQVYICLPDRVMQDSGISMGPAPRGR